MFVAAVKQIYATDTDGSQRIAVIGVANAQECVTIFRTLGFLPMILVRHLQGDFDRCCSAVRKEDFRQPHRSLFHQRTGQTNRRFTREAEQSAVSDLLQLFRDRPVNRRNRMPMHIAPQR